MGVSLMTYVNTDYDLRPQSHPVPHNIQITTEKPTQRTHNNITLPTADLHYSISGEFRGGGGRPGLPVYNNLIKLNIATELKTYWSIALLMTD